MIVDSYGIMHIPSTSTQYVLCDLYILILECTLDLQSSLTVDNTERYREGARGEGCVRSGSPPTHHDVAGAGVGCQLVLDVELAGDALALRLGQ